MATKKIPISFNDLDQKNLKELIDIMGITNVYGDIPKAVKFGINLALSALYNPEKVYCCLNENDLDTYFKSRLRVEKEREIERRAENIIKQSKKYNSEP